MKESNPTAASRERLPSHPRAPLTSRHCDCMRESLPPGLAAPRGNLPRGAASLFLLKSPPGIARDQAGGYARHEIHFGGRLRIPGPQVQADAKIGKPTPYGGRNRFLWSICSQMSMMENRSLYTGDAPWD